MLDFTKITEDQLQDLSQQTGMSTDTIKEIKKLTNDFSGSLTEKQKKIQQQIATLLSGGNAKTPEQKDAPQKSVSERESLTKKGIDLRNGTHGKIYQYLKGLSEKHPESAAARRRLEEWEKLGDNVDAKDAYVKNIIGRNIKNEVNPLGLTRQELQAYGFKDLNDDTWKKMNTPDAVKKMQEKSVMRYNVDKSVNVGNYNLEAYHNAGFKDLTQSQLDKMSNNTKQHVSHGTRSKYRRHKDLILGTKNILNDNELVNAMSEIDFDRVDKLENFVNKYENSNAFSDPKKRKQYIKDYREAQQNLRYFAGRDAEIGGKMQESAGVYGNKRTLGLHDKKATNTEGLGVSNKSANLSAKAGKWGKAGVGMAIIAGVGAAVTSLMLNNKGRINSSQMYGQQPYSQY